MKKYKQIGNHMNIVMCTHLLIRAGCAVSHTTFHKLQNKLPHPLTNVLWYPLCQRLYRILIDFNEDL